VDNQGGKMKITVKFSFLLLMLALAFPVFAQQNDIPTDDPGDNIRNGRDRANRAARVFRDMMGKPDRAIPSTILDKADAVIIIPGAVRAAFGIGGRGGRGIVSRRTAMGWSEPAFVKIGGGSFGAQIGVTQTDYIFLVMNEGGIQNLLEDGFELGGDIGATAGPIGREAGASTNLSLNAEILSYSRARGLYAGVALRGIRIYADDAMNKRIYNMNASDILNNSAGRPLNQMNRHLRTVPQTLARYSARKS
jgi:lipid-binding SYLF domain-containing protein